MCESLVSGDVLQLFSSLARGHVYQVVDHPGRVAYARDKKGARMASKNARSASQMPAAY